MDPIKSFFGMGAKTDTSRNLVQNKFDFYSGSQITIWFGNICLDDVVSIQWNRTQDKKPLYGYASRQFDAVANGIVTVSGSFLVNFRQVGYISMLMNQIKSLYDSSKTNQNWDVIKNVIGQHLKQGTFGPKTAEEIKALGDSDTFLAAASAYEDIIWGGGIPGDTLPTVSPDDSVKPYLAGVSQIAGASDLMQSETIPNGFNILITYGNTSGNQSRTIGDYLKSTVKSIVGVHLVGESQAIQVGGQPVMEQYDFIARGTDEQLGNER